MKGSTPKEMCGKCGRFMRVGFSECERDGCPFEQETNEATTAADEAEAIELADAGEDSGAQE